MPTLFPALFALVTLATPVEGEIARDGSTARQGGQPATVERLSDELDAATGEAPGSPGPAAATATTPSTTPAPPPGGGVGRAPLARVKGEASVTLNAGLDTNARRVIGETAVTDAFAGLAAKAKGDLFLGRRHLLHGRYDIGLKKFINLDAEDLMVQRLNLGYAAHIPAWTFEADANGKLRSSRNGLRDYLDLFGLVSARRQIGRKVAIKGELGLRQFSYPHEDDYGYWSTEIGLWGFWQIHRRINLALGVRGVLPNYEGDARAPDATYGTQARRDKLLSVRLQASYRGPVAVQAGYLWVGNWSNSFGESFQRHRVFAAMTARLPWSIFVGLHLAWQALHYPDGLFLSDDLIDLLLYDDESQSSSTLKLARPLSEHLEIELKYSLSWVALPRRDDDSSLSYFRQVATIGLVGRF